MKNQVLVIAFVLLSMATVPAFAEWRVAGGVTLVDSQQRPVYGASYWGEDWYGELGTIQRTDENVWIGAGRILDLGDVDLTIGGVWLRDTSSRVSRGANFAFGLHTTLGPMVFSIRHISNGAQTFGHGRYPNTGENWLSIGWRFR